MTSEIRELPDRDNNAQYEFSGGRPSGPPEPRPPKGGSKPAGGQYQDQPGINEGKKHITDPGNQKR